jgi:hypothetical protein
MSSMNGETLNALLSTPLAIPASVAVALAALFLVLLLMSIKRAGPGMARLLMAFVALAVFTAGITIVVDRMTRDERAAEQRALLARNIELTARAVTTGSMLSCLDAGAGEAVENACEKSVFASASSAADAVAYIGARLTLLADAASFTQDNAMLGAFAAARRSIELDRYGIAAHVLSERDGCTPDKCPAFGLLRDTAAVKANLRAHAFDNYVARYVDAWNKAEPKPAPVAAIPLATPSPALASMPGPEHAKSPVSSKYDFPSAASIPPVSIMNAEPPLPKEPAKEPAAAEATAPPAEEKLAPEAKSPVPPKRRQKQAAEPPAR